MDKIYFWGPFLSPQSTWSFSKLCPVDQICLSPHLFLYSSWDEWRMHFLMFERTNNRRIFCGTWKWHEIQIAMPIKLYGDPTMPVYWHTVYGCFCRVETTGFTKPIIFTVWPLKRKFAYSCSGERWTPKQIITVLLSICDVLDIHTRVFRSKQAWILFIIASGLVMKSFVEVSLRRSEGLPETGAVREKITRGAC